ncbi:hypothetical protein QCD60_14560 [Pokkaliibacter sp. MBI-7]|uniref:hypothetical protein n=1 Tax=Pokkaliibacter sp. MBI-7 TaxID=3040600 RepID=UPI002446AD46|nr:hypothetical protein [Pokkaliibacter sp. MBI-7]MDH2433792.1 hypothetical protein [Pokkaliibacter sp. MBI-7]
MDRVFPDILAKMHAIEIDYANGEGIDFEPFDTFFSEEETAHWIKAWTANESLDGREYLIFGQDGTGGYAAFWCVRNTSDILQQPIVFMGSEGELGIIAQSFKDYVWLFANGVGPCEAVGYPDIARPQNPEFLEFAQCYAPENKASVSEIINRAKSEFPDFEKDLYQLCC